MRHAVVAFSAAGVPQWETLVLGNSLSDFATDRTGASALITNPPEWSDQVEMLRVYEPSGGLRWERPLWSTGEGGLDGMLLLNALAFTPEGDLIAVGEAYDSFTMDGQAFQSSELGPPLVMKLRGSDGSLLWAQLLDGVEGDFLEVHVLPSGELRIRGSFYDGQGTWARDRLYGSRQQALTAIVALSPEGHPLWGRHLPQPLDTLGRRLVPDGDDLLVVLWGIQRDACRRPGVLRMGPAGQFSEALRFPCMPCDKEQFMPQPIELQDAALLPDGSLALSGFFRGEVDFGTGPIRAQGPYDAFLLSLTPPPRTW